MHDTSSSRSVHIQFEQSIVRSLSFHKTYKSAFWGFLFCFFWSYKFAPGEFLGLGRNFRNVAEWVICKKKLANVTGKEKLFNFQENQFGSIPWSHCCNWDNLKMWLKQPKYFFAVFLLSVWLHAMWSKCKANKPL